MGGDPSSAQYRRLLRMVEAKGQGLVREEGKVREGGPGHVEIVANWGTGIAGRTPGEGREKEGVSEGGEKMDACLMRKQEGLQAGKLRCSWGEGEGEGQLSSTSCTGRWSGRGVLRPAHHRLAWSAQRPYKPLRRGQGSCLMRAAAAGSGKVVWGHTQHVCQIFASPWT